MRMRVLMWVEGGGVPQAQIFYRGRRGGKGKGPVVSFMRMETGAAISTVAAEAVSTCCSYKNCHK